MKTMKNVLMILLGAALVLSLAGVGAVAAADETGDGATSTTGKQITGPGIKSGNFKVTYTIDDSYSVTIPSDVTPSKTEEPASTTLKVESAMLANDYKLVVEITSAKGWKMQLGETNHVIPYTMKYDNDNDVEVTVNKDSNVVTVTICEVTESITTEDDVISKLLSFKMDDPNHLPTVAGEYIDTLTITVTPTPTTGTTPADPAE